MSEYVLPIVLGALASSGFWGFAIAVYTSKKSKQSASNKMLLGLGHNEIMRLGKEAIERGYITSDDFENLHDYLYLPYKEMGGNGSAERIVNEVKKLPIAPNN